MRGSFMVLRQKKYLGVLFYPFSHFSHSSPTQRLKIKNVPAPIPPPPLLGSIWQLTAALEQLKDTHGRASGSLPTRIKRPFKNFREHKTKLNSFSTPVSHQQVGKDLPMEVTPPQSLKCFSAQRCLPIPLSRKVTPGC
jgi:hypothetical protein